MRARTPRAIRRRGPVAPRIPPNLSRHTQTRPTDISTDPTPYPPLVETRPRGGPKWGVRGGPKMGVPGGPPREKKFQIVPTGRVIKYPKKCALFCPPRCAAPPGGPPDGGSQGGSQYYKIIPFWPENGQIWARAPGGEISPPGAPRGPPGRGAPAGPPRPPGGAPRGGPPGGSRRGSKMGSQKGVPKGGPKWGPDRAQLGPNGDRHRSCPQTGDGLSSVAKWPVKRPER